MKLCLKILLIISLIIQGLTTLFAFAPGLLSAYSMVLPLINMVIYLVIFFILFSQRINILSLLLLLFIPLYAYSAFHISSVGDITYFIVSVITLVYISALSVIILIKYDKLQCFDYKYVKIITLILLIVCGILIIESFKIETYYYDKIRDNPTEFIKILFYFPLFMYIGLIIVYSFLAIITLKKFKKK